MRKPTLKGDRENIKDITDTCRSPPCPQTKPDSHPLHYVIGRPVYSLSESGRRNNRLVVWLIAPAVRRPCARRTSPNEQNIGRSGRCVLAAGVVIRASVIYHYIVNLSNPAAIASLTVTLHPDKCYYGRYNGRTGWK
ncbi:hypothetical protein DPEC_G00137660 [Dallia pectoralis]|uniref:Uncharacterized protein n=1 Tax=Dallia pectoralis TaxID=75939 RepID=A0ACC2GLP8_DALPE|nr:hypothetical protein DPEC_G00137660 [Dallia pectoralis]